MRARWRWWVGFGIVSGAALWLTQRAYREGLPAFLDTIWQADKVLHVAISGLAVFFLDGALARRAAFTVAGLAVPLAAVLILVPVAIEECLQSLSPLRNSSIGDLAADLLGVALFIPLSRRLAR